MMIILHSSFHNFIFTYGQLVACHILEELSTGVYGRKYTFHVHQ